MLQKTPHATTVRFASWLSPLLYETYAYIARYIGACLGLLTSLQNGGDLSDFAREDVEIGFLCGLLYVHMARDVACAVELLAAPVLEGERYHDAPIYFSDVIVHQNSPYRCFNDLQGCAWAYNERASHSGYNLVNYSLWQRGKQQDYFGSTIETGAHLQSLRFVLEGKADAAALDSHLLDVLFAQHPDKVSNLRIIDALGPSSIPPLVVAKRLDYSLKEHLREALLTMHTDTDAARQLQKGCIKRFVYVSDEQYHDIRSMYALNQGC